MGTLRKKYHDLANRINLVVMELGCLKAMVARKKALVLDEELYTQIVTRCERSETGLMEFHEELLKVKAVVYGHIDPDKDWDELVKAGSDKASDG